MKTKRQTEYEAIKDKLEEKHGMSGHPKGDLLYAKAWDLGHSAGESEIGIYYADLLELVKD